MVANQELLASAYLLYYFSNNKPHNNMAAITFVFWLTRDWLQNTYGSCPGLMN